MSQVWAGEREENEEKLIKRKGPLSYDQVFPNNTHNNIFFIILRRVWAGAYDHRDTFLHLLDYFSVSVDPALLPRSRNTGYNFCNIEYEHNIRAGCSHSYQLSPAQ